MKFRPSARWASFLPLIFAPLLAGNPLLSTAAAQDAASSQDDAAKRLQWLKARGLAAPDAPAKPKPAPSTPSSTPATNADTAAGAAILKRRFSETRSQQLRPVDAAPAAGTTASKKTAPASEKSVASAPSAPSSAAPEVSAPKPAEKLARDTNSKPAPAKESANAATTAKGTNKEKEAAVTKATAKAGTAKDAETKATGKGKTDSTKPATAVVSVPTKEANAAAKTASVESPVAKKSSATEKKVAPATAVSATPTPESRATAAKAVAAAKPQPTPTPSPVVTAKAAESAAARMLKTPATAAMLAPSQKPIVSSRSTETTQHGVRLPVASTAVSETDERIVTTKTMGARSRYPWKTNIVTTVFWVGERPSGNNFTPNYASSWDRAWTQSYGGFDNPDPDHRRNFIPIKFTPRQNPFYVALPYNDVTRGTTKPESRRVIPWFKDAFEREGLSVCHNRWVAIRSRSGKIAFAQWSDCGPFRTDHWQYVFGNERPKPNLNKGAGLDVSPAVRDYLGIAGTDMTDWRFVEAHEVPQGPWALYGNNNTARRGGPRLANSKSSAKAKTERKGSTALAAAHVAD